VSERSAYSALRAAQSVGLSASQGALYSALFNVASAFGRLAFGYLGDVALGVRPVLQYFCEVATDPGPEYQRVDVQHPHDCAQFPPDLAKRLQPTTHHSVSTKHLRSFLATPS
jgi:hypothetical protein